MINYFFIVILCLLIQCPYVSYGQGTYYFSNYVPSLGLDSPVFASDGERLSGPNYLAALYAGPNMDSLTLVDTAPFLTGAMAGYFRDPGQVFAPVAAGDFGWLQVTAWDARLGPTFEAAKARDIGGYGYSAVFQQQSGGAGAPPTLPAALLGMKSFRLLLEVPESNTVVLFVFGLILIAAKCSRAMKP
ncbi:MAG: hypothetical protein M1608_15865 [Candidatus Omnitrophica bacterium]|nr:hypothetical protein [Candidatus Omnitrophota bacterium]